MRQRAEQRKEALTSRWKTWWCRVRCSTVEATYSRDLACSRTTCLVGSRQAGRQAGGWGGLAFGLGGWVGASEGRGQAPGGKQQGSSGGRRARGRVGSGSGGGQCLANGGGGGAGGRGGRDGGGGQARTRLEACEGDALRQLVHSNVGGGRHQHLPLPQARQLRGGGAGWR